MSMTEKNLQQNRETEEDTADTPAERGPTRIWNLYQAGIKQHQYADLYHRTELCHWMYEGDQWHGVKTGGEELPMENLIEPIVKYQVACVAQNDTTIVFSPIGDAKDDVLSAVCNRLDKFASAEWERLKMDSRKWEMVRNAAIEGDFYAYVFDATPRTESVVRPQEPHLKMRFLHRTQIYLEDEQNPNLDEQGYIIVAFRQPVKAVRKLAKKNGISEDQIKQIRADSVDETVINTEGSEEVESDTGKCTVLLYMELTPGGLKFCRSTEQVIFEPEATIEDMDVYPIAAMRWQEKSGSARGVSCVEPLIANQITINKTLARRAIVVKHLAFPNKVVDDSVTKEDADAIGTAGATIRTHGAQGGTTAITNHVGYIQPPQMNGDAAALQGELLAQTRELKGASSSATGQIDPTKTSGEAIKAARDQSAMNLTEQAAAYKQWVEDLSRIMYKLLIAYSTDGLHVEITAEGINMQTGEASTESVPAVVTKEALKQMDMNVRIDVSPTDPYSVLSQEMALENALNNGHIKFDEYIEAIPDNAGVPKGEFQKIMKQRKEAAEAQQTLASANPMMAMQQAQSQQNAQDASADISQAADGGMENGNMSGM